jgi:hypothetical protein
MSKGVKYWGKYRGTVVNNADPQQIGRLLVDVPNVGGLSPNSWAMPCLPMTGKRHCITAGGPGSRNVRLNPPSV